MRLDVVIEGDLNALMTREFQAGERAVTAAMRIAGAELKADWRGQIVSAGLGNKLAKAVQSQNFPKTRQSMNAAALVYSKAPKITLAQETGPLIRSADGFWLAIPLPAAGKGRRGARMTPDDWEKRTGRRLTFLYPKGRVSYGPNRSALLVDTGQGRFRGRNDPVSVTESRSRRRARKSVPIFVLVPQAKIRKKLNLFAAGSRVASGLPAAIVANWKSDT